MNGAMSTFLAVAVLPFCKSYVIKTLTIQFVLTVSIGFIQGLVLLPVLLSLFEPQPFASAEAIHLIEVQMAKRAPETEHTESFGVRPDPAVDRDA